MNLDVAGALLGPDGAHDAMQFHRGGARLGQHRRRASDFLIDAMLRFDLAGLMMDQRPEFAFFLARAAGENQNRHALGERSRDRIYHIVAAGAVGHADYPDTSSRARVAVGSEADPGFMRERDDLQPMAAPERKEQLEREIAGDAENVLDADLAQVGDQEISERHMPLHHASPSCPKLIVTKTPIARAVAAIVLVIFV